MLLLSEENVEGAKSSISLILYQLHYFYLLLVKSSTHGSIENMALVAIAILDFDAYFVLLFLFVR